MLSATVSGRGMMVLRRLTLLILTVTATARIDAQDLRPFTVRDAVQMVNFDNGSIYSSTGSHDDGTVSPDGRFAMRTTHRGVLPEGLTEGTLWLFDVADVVASIENEEATPAAPIALVRMSAAVNGPAGDFRNWNRVLLHPRWSGDGQSVFFLGRDEQENRRLYNVDIDSKNVSALSPSEQDVVAYSMAGQHVAYLAGPNVDPDELWRAAGTGMPDITVGTGTPLIPLLFPNYRPYDGVEPLNFEVWRVRDEIAEPIRDEESGNPLSVSANFADTNISISPDGTQAVAVVSAPWSPFDSATESTYKIIDLETGQAQNVADLDAADLVWTPFARPESDDSPAVTLEVSQGLNQPPVLVATNPGTGKSRTIFDPNPQFANISLLPVEIFEWEDRHGRSNVGGLLKPQDFDTSQQYPLVIQTHGFRQNRFFRTGYTDTATAGRALASRGVVVLQVNEQVPPEEDIESPLDLAEAGLDVYLGAIDKLSDDGMVDPSKVGIAGYSFSGLTAAHSIVHAPDRFAAALIANADPLTVTGYFSYVDSPLHGAPERYFVGTTPFGDGLQTWIEKSPSLSADAITAAVLISAADPMHLLSLWDFYAALRYQRKPVELQYIRSGKHNIAQPLHIFAHQEMMVDWFDFWLYDHEVPDPRKTNQYERWRELRELRERTQ